MRPIQISVFEILGAHISTLEIGHFVLLSVICFLSRKLLNLYRSFFFNQQNENLCYNLWVPTGSQHAKFFLSWMVFNLGKKSIKEGKKTLLQSILYYLHLTNFIYLHYLHGFLKYYSFISQSLIFYASVCNLSPVFKELMSFLNHKPLALEKS